MHYWGVSTNSRLRPRIGDGWAIYNFLPERLPVNEQKAEVFLLLLNREFSAELLPNSEQKVDEMHVTPSYCQCDVSHSFG